MADRKYVIGLDYGSDSVRSLIVDVANGEEVGTSVAYYPRWMEGKYCVPAENQYRQHPLDYLECLERVIKEALEQAPAGCAENVVGISFDTTGSTPVLTDEEGTPLALKPEFAENPNAMFVLWKDHTAIKEADEINALAESGPINYIKYEGGIYSSEWTWAKVTHILRNDAAVRAAAKSFIEHADWMPAVLTGTSNPKEVKRSRCAAGHKAMWHTDWNGLPPEEFLLKLDPVLKGIRDSMSQETYTSDTKVGYLTQEWADRLGLTTNVAVGVSAFDCHMGAVGAEGTPNTLVRVMGTSTCDILLADYEEMKDKLVAGICGQVDGSVVPGLVGLEAGQSAFGDVYAWFKRLVAWPIENVLAKTTLVDEDTKKKLIEEAVDGIIPALADEAEKLPLESKLVATDWFNGRRTPDANQKLKGTITGMNLGSTAPMLFKALVEATAYGSKAIVDRFIEQGVAINEVIAIGGVAKKSRFVMQTLCDVIQMPIKVSATDQTCAFGAAMFAAVAAGSYDKVQDAQDAMKKGFESTYTPNPAKAAYYNEQYKKYQFLGDTIGDKI